MLEEEEPIRIREKRERGRTRIKKVRKYIWREREKRKRKRKIEGYFSIRIEEMMMSSGSNTTNHTPEEETITGKLLFDIERNNLFFHRFGASKKFSDLQSLIW